MIIYIKEKSLIARIAALLMREKRIAIVFGSTIHLWDTPREEFIKSTTWLQHELIHVEQFKKYGYIKFIFMYTWELLKRGYYKNKFEVEARAKENESILPHYIH
jgi:hypothetical protein